MEKYLVLAVAMAIASICGGQDAMSPSRDRLAMGEHRAYVAGIQFWYRVAGHGPILVVQAPGWGVGSEYLRNGLAQLEKNFTVIYYDTRGTARTSRPSDAKLMSTDDMIGDLGRLRDYWGLNAITVLGHSNGGAIALGYAILHPEMVHKLILVDMCTEDHDFRTERAREIEARKDDPRFKEATIALGNFDAQTDEEFSAYLKKIMPLFFYDPATGMPRFARTDTMLPSIWARRAVEAPGLPVTKQESMLDRVRAQTLVLVGHDDWICPVTQGQRLNQGIQNSRLVVLDKSGHFPWIEAPKGFFAEVVQFAK